MNTANTPYTFGLATGEIIILLLLAFLIGMLLCWILRGLGLCCRQRKPHIPEHIAPVLEDEPYTSHYGIKPSVSSMAAPALDMPETDVIDIEPEVLEMVSPELPENMPDIKADILKFDPLLDSIDPHKPIVALPDMDTSLDMELDVPDMEADILKFDPLLDSIDPHKPIVDLPDMDIDMEQEVSATQFDPLLANIDPHKPIIDPPDMELEPVALQTTTPETEAPELDPLLANIDPHKPIIDPPDMPEAAPTGSSTGHTLNDWLHKAKGKVEHLTEKTTPAANDWLNKAREKVEHLTEKTTPTTNEWLHKARETVEHLSEKATPVANDWLHKAREKVEHLTEKATPTTNEWLHKAKEIGDDLSAKGNSLGSETLVKSSSTLAALAASAKELTEKLASNLNIHNDDLQKLKGIGPTFASILHRAGIHTYQQLAETSPQKLRALLIVEDEQFHQHDTSSWPQQATLAAQGEWEKLKEYQDTLSEP